MGTAGGEPFAFEGFTLDLTRGCLLGSAGEIELRPKSFELLRYLTENAGRLISKDELVNAVWRNVIVSDDSLAQCVSELRHVLGDPDRRIIKTVPRRGYLFAAPVTVSPRHSSIRQPGPNPSVGADQAHSVEEALPIEPAVSPARPQPLSLPDKPSIAVLPFANMSGDPEQEYFADGMAEEIITALSRIRWLFVIARNSSFTYKGQAADVKQVGRELGVRYVLEGSVRKGGNRVRITAQLIDAQSSAHLWADRFDGSLEDVFDLQDKVASSVAGVIEPTLQAAETARLTHRPTNDLTAYDLYLRAYAMLWLPARHIPEALRLAERAIARDPHYGPALALAAVYCYRLVLDNRSQDPEADRLKGTALARRALEVAGDDPGVLVNAALSLAYFGEDIGAMIGVVDRALALNPNYARGWSISGNLRMWAGQPEIATEHVETALRLSPRARTGALNYLLGCGHFFSRRFDEAVPKLLLAIQDDPDFAPAYRCLAACYAFTERLDEARKVINRLRSITPGIMSSIDHFRNPGHRELLLSGLRLAAGETE